MIEKIFELMKDYEKIESFGKIKLVLLSDSSGCFYFEGADVRIEFRNLAHAVARWYEIFKIGV